LGIGDGLKVFDFHPIHVFLNSSSMAPYYTLKHHVPRLNEATAAEVEPFIYREQGTRSLFLELLQHLSATEASRCVRDVATAWHEETS